VSPLTLIRLATAHRLRQKAQRFRNLALTNEDDKDVGIMRALSVECDERASRIEQETSAR
jgi:hypothetical protein